MSSLIPKNLAIQALWRRGSLSMLLDSNQKSLYEMFHNNPAKVQTWLLARRSGKSYSLCVLSIEYCLKNPKSVIKYVAPTKMQVERFIRPIITQILDEGCPNDIKPEYHKSQNIYFFPNGSELQLCGAESGNIESIRGGAAHLAIIDEAQDVTNLKYAINSILLPTTQTTKGKVLISGTPPQDTDHDFISVIEEASAKKTLIKRTINDNPRISKEDIEIMKDAMGGEDSEDFRREYLCEILKSKSRSVVPEATDEMLSRIVRDVPKPDFYHAYVGMDVGMRDWTVVLFAYYDFFNDRIIIEDEISMYGPDMHLPILSQKILEKEETLWVDKLTNEVIKPKRRVSDHDLIVINEIKKFSNYRVIFDLADKKDRMAGINWIRNLIKSEKIIISPKCTTLIRHLKDGKWSNSSKDDLGKCPLGSHYDAIPALVYLTRAIDVKQNPYPKNYNSPLRKQDVYHITNNETDIKNVNVYKQILGLKKK